MTTESTRAPWLVPALVALGAAAVGLGAGWFLRGSNSARAADARPIEVQAAAAVTREELEAAKREILAQLEALGRARPTSSSAPAAASNDTVIELGRRLDDLDARIAVLATGVRPGIGGRAWANLRGPGCESIEKLCTRIQENWRRAQKDEVTEDISEALLREHHLWTIEDVVRAYGPPDRLTNANGLTLCYGRFALENVEDAFCVLFRIQEGFVTEVGYDSRNGW